MRPHHLLLVDDQPDGLLPLARLFKLSGHEVQTATTAAEALLVVDREPCDLVISDIGLPDRTGLELMRELRSRFGLRGIALTGFGEDHFVADCAAAGFAKHFLKPVNFADLLLAVEEVLETRSCHCPDPAIKQAAAGSASGS